MSGPVQHKKDSYAALASGAVLLATLSVFLVHQAALRLEAVRFHTLAPGPAIDFVNLLQVGLIGVLFVILGSILHRYPEPYFILWFFGWASWLLLYLSRLWNWTFTDIFNGLNSYFFFLAGATLIAPEGTKLSRWIENYPGNNLAAHFGGPVVWLARYFWMNWRALVPLPFMIAPAFIEVYHKDWQWPATGWASRPLYLHLEVLFSVVGITLLGCGLYRRFSTISRPVAVAAIAVHAVYLQPQLAKAIFDLTHAENRPGFLFEVLLTSVICKPALALFATLLALTETEHQRLRTLNQLQAAYVVVREGLVQFSNQQAHEMFGLPEGTPQRMAQLFRSPDEMAAISEKLRQTENVIGYYTFLKMANGGYKEFRIDAFRSGGSASQIILLILDRHDHAMAEAVVHYTHTSIKSRLLREERFPASAALVDDLFSMVRRLERIWRNYWDGSERKTATDSLKRCLDLTVMDFPSLKRQKWPVGVDYAVPFLDPESVEDIFKNIFANIFKHAYPGHVNELEKPVAVTFTQEGDFVIIRVTDQGCGFCEDVIAEVNKPNLIGKYGLGFRSLKLTVAASPDGRVEIGNNQRGPGAWVEIRLRAVPVTDGN